MAMTHNKRTGPIRTILLYGLLLGVVLVGFKLFEYSYFSRHITLDIYLGLVAIAFLIIGLTLGIKGGRRKSPEIDAEAGRHPTTDGSPSISHLGATARVAHGPTLQLISDTPEPQPEVDLSKRELEVLTHLVEGCTNQEIAEALFLSPNTIKTHVRNIYRKLDVERRAQAVGRAKELNIVR